MATGRLRRNLVTTATPDGRATDEEQEMSRYERRIYFELLVEMRLAYEVLDDVDRTAVITIDEVIAWAERELSAAWAPGSTPRTEP